MKDQRTPFDEADDDRDAAVGQREGLLAPSVERVIASSASSKGGAPCQEGDGESPSQPLPEPNLMKAFAMLLKDASASRAAGERPDILPSDTIAAKPPQSGVGPVELGVNECRVSALDPANSYITGIEAEAYVSNPSQTQPTRAAMDQAERVLIEALGPTDSLWREMPHEQFMRMSEHEQLDYCARRDEDSARFADTYEDEAWYLWRAKWYRERMERIP